MVSAVQAARQGLRRHPVLISAPLAVLALTAGFAARALLSTPQRASSESRLLEALIAQPKASPASAVARQAPPDEAGLSSAADLQAHRAGSTARGSSMSVPERGPQVALEIRVALMQISPRPRLGASGPWRLRDRSGQVIRQGQSGETFDVGGLMASRSELWLETTPHHHLSADGRPYAGRFRLLRGADGLQVVNHLPLEGYISSVVGGEMPSNWNLEALRAQAVAARSYALAHMARPADDHWHLGDTTRWQNYTGLASVTDRTLEATQSTAGIILSFQGGIVESLYAATQQISQEAHGHLGASMSQHGAQDLASQGFRFNEILGRYYQGASLARLQTGAG